MAATIFLALITAYDPAVAGEVVLNYSDGTEYVPGVPSPSTFDTRLLQAVSIRRDLFTPGATQGKTSIALGDLVLNNADGGLDHILEYGFDGRDLLLFVGPDGGTYPTDFTALPPLTMQEPEWNSTRITLRVRDRQFDTTLPIQSTLYAGTGGVEGGSNVKGKPKPLTFGTVYNAPGTIVDSALNIFQWHTGPLQSIAPYDKGKTLTLGTAHASYAALAAATVAANTYHTWLAGGMARTATPAGTITADVVEGATAADRTVAQLAKRALLQGGVLLADIDAAAVTAMDAANASEAGIFIGSENVTPTAAVLDELYGSIGAWWGQGSDGKFTGAVFTAPSGTPDASFIEDELLRFERASGASGLPIWRTTVGYQKNYTVQEGDAVDSSVTAARRAFLERAYRTVFSEDATVKTKHPLAMRDEVYTLLINSANAQTEAARRQPLRGVTRRKFEVRVELKKPAALAVKLGGVIQITHSRYGYSAGKLFRVISHEPDAKNGRLNLLVWG